MELDYDHYSIFMIAKILLKLSCYTWIFQSSAITILSYLSDDQQWLIKVISKLNGSNSLVYSHWKYVKRTVYTLIAVSHALI